MAPIASIINWQDSTDADSYGVAVLALANRTDINGLADIPGKIVSLPGFSAPFQMLATSLLCTCLGR